MKRSASKKEELGPEKKKKKLLSECQREKGVDIQL